MLPENNDYAVVFVKDRIAKRGSSQRRNGRML